MRWPWLIFGTLLACGIVAFSLGADWSSESWLDLAAYPVSVIGILSTLLYGSGRALSGAAFWRMFRWLFIGVVALQGFFHALQVARHRDYSAAATVGFIFIAAVFIGWVYALQWIAMTRLAQEHGS
jgi:hypothetical protein